MTTSAQTESTTRRLPTSESHTFKWGGSNPEDLMNQFLPFTRVAHIQVGSSNPEDLMNLILPFRGT